MGYTFWPTRGGKRGMPWKESSVMDERMRFGGSVHGAGRANNDLRLRLWTASVSECPTNPPECVRETVRGSLIVFRSKGANWPRQLQQVAGLRFLDSTAGRV